jgi:hypothetical protein
MAYSTSLRRTDSHYCAYTTPDSSCQDYFSRKSGWPWYVKTLVWLEVDNLKHGKVLQPLLPTRQTAPREAAKRAGR